MMVKIMNPTVHKARLDKILIRDLARNNLDLSKTAINLIIHLTPFVDRDGSIHFNKEAVRKQMMLERRTFNSALNELRETSYKGKKLLTYKDGYYVSNFHLSSNGKTTYLKHLEVFNSPEFLNLTKNQTRLFLYIATLNIKNQSTKVAVENLYKNQLHDKDYGMSIYDSYKDMRDDLFFLIDNGFVSVRLPGESTDLNSDDSSYKETFDIECGFKENKKFRTSKYHKEKHSIGLRVNPKLFQKDPISNVASESELRLLSDRFHIFHEDMKEETFNFIIGKKNNLIEQFGKAGLEIYRASLEKYFVEKHENIVYYDLLGKAADHFADFYLLEEMKRVILSAIKYVLGSGGSEFRKSDDLISNEYSFKDMNIPSLVEYFIANSSDEHKILIDQDLQQIEEAHDLMNGFTAEKPWTYLWESIEATYESHTPLIKDMFMAECIKTKVREPIKLFAQINPRELIVSLAEKSLLSQKKELDQETSKLKQIVRFFRKKQMPHYSEYAIDVEAIQPEEKPEGNPYDWIKQQ
jgi:hypothetical protein